MDFASAVKTINKLLIEKQPYTFNSTWIREYAPHSYRFIQKNIRAESGDIDWDRITRALDLTFQRKWIPSWRKRTKRYRSKIEVQLILHQYSSKLYSFLTPVDKNDKNIRDLISIALVRIAQKGNIIAKKEIINLVRFTIDDWIDRCPKISCWKGYDCLIQERIEGCIRRYRYSGSFLGYLFRTLQYAGRGLRPLIAYSLDDSLCSGVKRRTDGFAQNPETGGISRYSRNTKDG